VSDPNKDFPFPAKMANEYSIFANQDNDALLGLLLHSPEQKTQLADPLPKLASYSPSSNATLMNIQNSSNNLTMVE
jgi:hypothetical protein